MKQPTFPTYKTPEIASNWGCHSCCNPLNPENIRDDGYADGRGRYCIKCDHCQMTTWFDIEKELTK